MALASIHLKMQTHWFNGAKIKEEEGEELAYNLIDNINHRVYKCKNEESKGLTSVPYFDIAFESIFPDLEEQLGSKVANVSSRLHLLKDLFGMKHLRTLHDIKNQSFFTLNGVVPELNRKVSASEVRTSDYLAYVSLEKKFVLKEPSRIICDRDARKVLCSYQIRNHLPSYLKTHYWQLIFDRFVDGTSLT